MNLFQDATQKLAKCKTEGSVERIIKVLIAGIKHPEVQKILLSARMSISS